MKICLSKTAFVNKRDGRGWRVELGDLIPCCPMLAMYLHPNVASPIALNSWSERKGGVEPAPSLCFAWAYQEGTSTYWSEPIAFCPFCGCKLIYEVSEYDDDPNEHMCECSHMMSDHGLDLGPCRKCQGACASYVLCHRMPELST
jgi:hypothetical protein